MSLPNPGMDFTPFDTLPASDLDDLVENIEALADGTGLDDSAITSAKINAAAVTPVKWTNPYKFRAYRSSTQSINAATTALVVMNAEDFDSNSNFDTTTGRYTVPVTGFYFFAGAVNFSAGSGDQYYSTLHKNAAEEVRGMDSVASVTFGHTYPVAGLVSCTVGDVIDLRFRNGSGGAKSTGAGRTLTFLSGYLVSIT